MKETKTTDMPKKSSQTTLLSAFGTRERVFLVQSQLPLRQAVNDFSEQDIKLLSY